MTWLKGKQRALKQMCLGRPDPMQGLWQQRKVHRVQVNQPLVLISQISRSGGTLLSQLFANHSDVHGHPGELTIGYPKKDHWPDFDLAGSPRRWIGQLFERRLVEYAREGFVKVPSRRRKNYHKSEITFPFLFLPGLMEEIFLAELPGKPASHREVIDAYFTAYFNAWLDYQGLYEPKRYVIGFTPKLALRPDSVERFFRDYPDGRMISIIRDPSSWYVSMRGRRDALVTVDDVLPKWVSSAEAALENKKRYGNRVHLLAFEDLLGNTEGTMRELARWLDLEWNDILLRPTFQGMDIKANSSFKVEQTGVLDAPMKRAGELDAADTATIEQVTGQLYDKIQTAIETERS